MPGLLHSPDGRIQEVTKVHVNRERRQCYSPLAPVADCVHQARRRRAEECRPKKLQTRLSKIVRRQLVAPQAGLA